MRLVDHHHRLWNSVQNRTEQHPGGPLGIFGKKYFRPTYHKIEVGAWTALAPESTPGGSQGVLRDASTNKHQTNLPMESRVPILVNRAVGSPFRRGKVTRHAHRSHRAHAPRVGPHRSRPPAEPTRPYDQCTHLYDAGCRAGAIGPLLTAEEMDKAVAKWPPVRPPQQQ